MHAIDALQDMYTNKHWWNITSGYKLSAASASETISSAMKRTLTFLIMLSKLSILNFDRKLIDNAKRLYTSY